MTLTTMLIILGFISVLAIYAAYKLVQFLSEEPAQQEPMKEFPPHAVQRANAVFPVLWEDIETMQRSIATQISLSYKDFCNYVSSESSDVKFLLWMKLQEQIKTAPCMHWNEDERAIVIRRW